MALRSRRSRSGTVALGEAAPRGVAQLRRAVCINVEVGITHLAHDELHRDGLLPGKPYLARAATRTQLIARVATALHRSPREWGVGNRRAARICTLHRQLECEGRAWLGSVSGSGSGLGLGLGLRVRARVRVSISWSASGVPMEKYGHLAHALLMMSGARAPGKRL
eukprot:scaffold24925_cov66-Phaeocystis_antarctica.AAC.2